MIFVTGVEYRQGKFRAGSGLRPRFSIHELSNIRLLRVPYLVDKCRSFQPTSISYPYYAIASSSKSHNMRCVVALIQYLKSSRTSVKPSKHILDRSTDSLDLLPHIGSTLPDFSNLHRVSNSIRVVRWELSKLTSLVFPDVDSSGQTPDRP